MFCRYGFLGLIALANLSCAGSKLDDSCLGAQVPPLTLDAAEKRVQQLGGGQPFAFEGADGTPRTAFRFASTTKPQTLLIGLHGLTSHAGWLAPIARELAQEGIETWTMDRLGTATNARKQRGDVADWRTWTADVQRLLVRAEQEHPGTPVVLWGYSLGAVIAAAYLAEVGAATPVDHAIMMAPGWATTQPHPLARPFLVAGSYVLPGGRVKPPIRANLALADTLSVMASDDSVTRSMTLRYLRQIHQMQTFANARLGHWDKPVTVLLARCDTLVDNARVRTLAGRLRQSPKIVEASGLGHMLVLEDAQRVAALLHAAIPE
jgi:alpha-beta hydrolase superfamily lysophospholipase